MAYKFGQLTKKSVDSLLLKPILYSSSITDLGNKLLTFDSLLSTANTYKVTLTIKNLESLIDVRLRIQNGKRKKNIARFKITNPCSQTIFFSSPFEVRQLALIDNEENHFFDSLNYNCTIELVPSIVNHSPWLKVGFYSRPGTIIIVNNEPIMIGRSEMFLLHNDIKIRNFSILPNEQGIISAFILDYMYEE